MLENFFPFFFPSKKNLQFLNMLARAFEKFKGTQGSNNNCRTVKIIEN